MTHTQDIKDNIGLLKEFGSDLGSFFARNKSKTLFKSQPPREETENAVERLREGRYLLRPCGSEFEAESLGSIAIELFDLLVKHLPDRKEALDKFRSLLTEDTVSLPDFISCVFGNQGNEVMKVVRQHDLEQDLITFFAVYLARPLRERAASQLTEGIDLANWTRGYCPVCGHWPSLGHIGGEEGHRTLWCLHCNTRWRFPRIQCVFCLTTDHKVLETLSPASQEEYRIQTCSTCKRYLKEIRTSDPVDSFYFDTVYLGTLVLDVLASQNGFIQESNLTVRYEDPDGNELLMYRQERGSGMDNS